MLHHFFIAACVMNQVEWFNLLLAKKISVVIFDNFSPSAMTNNIPRGISSNCFIQWLLFYFTYMNSRIISKCKYIESTLNTNCPFLSYVWGTFKTIHKTCLLSSCNIYHVVIRWKNYQDSLRSHDIILNTTFNYRLCKALMLMM